jgi:uncharacterized membrane protein
MHSRALFLCRLRQGLKGLPSPLADDIVEDYDVHFVQGAAAGRSESDVAAALGDPVSLAWELVLASGAETGRGPRIWPLQAATGGA